MHLHPYEHVHTLTPKLIKKIISHKISWMSLMGLCSFIFFFFLIAIMWHIKTQRKGCNTKGLGLKACQEAQLKLLKIHTTKHNFLSKGWQSTCLPCLVRPLGSIPNTKEAKSDPCPIIYLPLTQKWGKNMSLCSITTYAIFSCFNVYETKMSNSLNIMHMKYLTPILTKVISNTGHYDTNF